MLNVTLAITIFIVTFALIISGKLHRTIVGAVGALSMMLLGTFGGFYSQDEALAAIDFNTLGLLLGMMIIVNVLKRSGFFSYVAIKTVRMSKGSPTRLMIFMGLVTAFMSMLVDNVTTIILVVPVTILVCDILSINPIPTLMAEILLANIGGVGTLVGDPPNMMIASASGFTFIDFLIHLLPLVLITMGVSVLALRFIFRKDLDRPSRNVDAVLYMKEKDAIQDPNGLVKCLLALGFVFLLFFLQERHGLSHSFIAIIGAGLTLLLVRPDPDAVLRDVEWSILVFFACLFIIVGGLERIGFLESIANFMIPLAQSNSSVMKVVLLWFSAGAASIIDRIPFTAAMIPIIEHIGELGININSLWWILALGVGFGGNGTPIGSTVGIIGIQLSEKSRNPIHFKQWFVSGTIVAVISIAVVSLLIAFI